MAKEIAILILSAWLFNKNTIFKKMSTWGWFHKSWARGANHLDISVHLRSPPMPNFLRSYFVAQKFSVGRETAYEIDPWLPLN